MRHKPLLIALVGLLLAASAHAQWKWRDAKGNVQYSDMPPPAGTPEKDILQRPPGARPTIVVSPPPSPASAAPAPTRPASAPTKAEQDAAARQKREQDGAAAKQKEEEQRIAAIRRDNCARAQSNMRELQSGTRMTRTNDKGERIFLDEAQLAAELARTRDTITSECR